MSKKGSKPGGGAASDGMVGNTRKDKVGDAQKDKETMEGDNQDPAFEDWLHRSLAELYAPVLKEPIPDEMVEIVKKHRQGH